MCKHNRKRYKSPILHFIQARKILDNEEKIQEFVRGLIAEHRLSFDPQQAPRDFIDLYLKAESDSNHELNNVITGKHLPI